MESLIGTIWDSSLLIPPFLPDPATSATAG